MTFQIDQISAKFDSDILHKIDTKTKPQGALGKLEHVAMQLGRIQANRLGKLASTIDIQKPEMMVFAGDHGIAKHGVSIAPPEVTQQMVANFAQGGAAINVFARQYGWNLTVIDAGILTEVDQNLGIVEQRLGSGTGAFHQELAMSLEQVEQGFELAKSLIAQKVQDGADLFAFGEMGIGNTSSASAILSSILNVPATQTVGRGTGIDPVTLEKKQQLIQQALDLHSPSALEPKHLLSKVGGFEIVQITGAILAAAEHQCPVLVDGFICTAAAMVAKLICPEVTDYLIFAHCSDEQAHIRMLEWFETDALLHLGMRLGEGTGAALALPILRSACAFYNEMASFADANVEDVVSE